jgi:sec-independent protein translocase protein TatA
VIRTSAAVVEADMTLISPIHIAFIGLIALVFLGPKRLPEMARGLGTGMREFRSSISGESHEPQLATVAATEHPLAQVPQQLAPPLPPAPGA